MCKESFPPQIKSNQALNYDYHQQNSPINLIENLY